MREGRGLDALIAEKVMGWTRVEPKYLTEPWRENVVALIPPGDDPGNDVSQWERSSKQGGAKTEVGDPAPPRYSTDIVAAKDVLGRIKRNCSIVIATGPESEGLERWHVNGTYHGYRPFLSRDAEVEADTLPHAICLAALELLTETETAA